MTACQCLYAPAPWVRQVLYREIYQNPLLRRGVLSKIVYKLFRSPEWAVFQENRAFSGSADDKRDGFIHLSASHQVATTFGKYFASENQPVLVAVDADALGDALKWEMSRGGDLFPHLYGVLERQHIREVWTILRDSGARPIFPPEIPEG